MDVGATSGPKSPVSQRQFDQLQKDCPEDTENEFDLVYLSSAPLVQTSANDVQAIRLLDLEADRRALGAFVEPFYFVLVS